MPSTAAHASSLELTPPYLSILVAVAQSDRGFGRWPFAWRMGAGEFGAQPRDDFADQRWLASGCCARCKNAGRSSESFRAPAAPFSLTPQHCRDSVALSLPDMTTAPVTLLIGVKHLIWKQNTTQVKMHFTCHDPAASVLAACPLSGVLSMPSGTALLTGKLRERNAASHEVLNAALAYFHSHKSVV